MIGILMRGGYIDVWIIDRHMVYHGTVHLIMEVEKPHDLSFVS